MDTLSKKLQIEQIDRKLAKLQALKETDIPPKGWISAIRTALGMSLVQLARKLGITSVSVKEIEEREQNKSITLKKLIEAGEALNLRFVYGFIPKHGSIEKMVEERALQVAKDLVMRTSHTMKLEEQENTEERLKEAIMDRAAAIQREMPKYLWD